MSTFITVNVNRAGTQILSGIQLQSDNMSAQEAAYYGGAAPYQRYAMYAFGLYDIRQRDQLVDTVNVDSDTGAAKQYRVINDPEPFPDQHMELVADRMIGT